MVTTIEAVFDGRVLRPEDPLTLEPNTRVRITIETPESRTEKPTSFLDTARSTWKVHPIGPRTCMRVSMVKKAGMKAEVHRNGRHNTLSRTIE